MAAGQRDGTFDADHQYVLRYRSTGDTSGYEVVTPLRTATGAVLVDRGIVSVTDGAQIPASAPAPPTGVVSVVGHVRRDEEGRWARVPVNGSMRLIDSGHRATLPYPVADGYIGLLTVDPPQAGGFAPVELPEISDGPHFWYAVQWFMFAGIGRAGVVVFIRGDLRERGRARSRKAGRGRPAAGPPEPSTCRPSGDLSRPPEPHLSRPHLTHSPPPGAPCPPPPPPPAGSALDLGLTDRVFVVTAASGGLGRARAAQLVAEGARVVLVARRAEVLAETVAELGCEQAVGVTADLTDPPPPTWPARWRCAPSDGWTGPW